ncbi:hypothetical protein HQ45_02960 [Porphyromonas crevioricanis]|uniref:hypothetical protein n=1 Tax=Porphyromonas crevioricanis TaxID=393921 RepID=UPI00052CE117|nr:hypothetical protein [Porphyromonas crevioricanis]KGN91074.1 hypothetical protein HQ45_02960 [Porphyromonas crevioricanis]
MMKNIGHYFAIFFLCLVGISNQSIGAQTSEVSSDDDSSQQLFKWISLSFETGRGTAFLNSDITSGENQISNYRDVMSGYNIRMALYFKDKTRSNLGLFVNSLNYSNQSPHRKVAEITKLDFGLASRTRMYQRGVHRIYSESELGASYTTFTSAQEVTEVVPSSRWGLAVGLFFQYAHRLDWGQEIGVKAFVNASPFFGKTPASVTIKPLGSYSLGLGVSLTL